MRKAERYVTALIKSRAVKRRVTAVILVLSLFVSWNVFYLMRMPGTALAESPVCGIEEHTHTDDCYEMQLVCTEEHEHSESCYGKVLICTKEEHTHSEGCYIDLASREKPSDWEAGLPKLKDDPSTNLMLVATSQIGYSEGADGYSRYGDWYGNETGDWNMMFISFCLHYAGISKTDIPYGSGCWAWQVKMDENELINSDIGELKEGNILLIDNDKDGKCDRAGIVIDINDKVITLVEGDVEGKTDTVEYKTDANVFIGFVSCDPKEVTEEPSEDPTVTPSPTEIPSAIPTAEPTTIPTSEPAVTATPVPTVTEAPSDDTVDPADPTEEPTIEPTPTATPTPTEDQEAPSDMEFEASTKSGIAVHVKAPAGAFAEGVTMTVTDVKDKDVMDEASETVDEGREIKDVLAVDITFTDADGNEVEPAEGYEIEVTISVPKKLQPEGDEFSLLHISDDGVSEVEDAEVSKSGAAFTTDSFSIFVLTGTGEKDKDRIDAFIYAAFGNDMTNYRTNGGTGDYLANSRDFPYYLMIGDTVELIGRIPESQAGEDLHFDFWDHQQWMGDAISINETYSSPTEVRATVTGLSADPNGGAVAVSLFAGYAALGEDFSIRVIKSEGNNHVIDFDTVNDGETIHVNFGDTITFRGTPNAGNDGDNWPYTQPNEVNNLLTYDYSTMSTENGVNTITATATGHNSDESQFQPVHFWGVNYFKTVNIIVHYDFHRAYYGDNNNPAGNFYDEVLDHADIEIADGGVYTNVSFEIGDDDGLIKTVTEYQSYVSAVNSCRIYNKDINSANDNPTFFFTEEGGNCVPYPVNGYDPDEYAADPQFMPGDSQYELTSKWNGIGNYLYRDVDHVIFDVGMQIVPVKIEKYEYDAEHDQWVLLTDLTEEYEIDYNAKKYNKIVGGNTIIYQGEISDITDDVPSTVFALGKRYVIDAYNKCPNHTGLDFTVHANHAAVQFGATKKLTNGKLNGNDFTFELVDHETGNVVSRKNDENGKVTFDTIQYEEPGVHHYYVREVDESASNPNIVFDDTEYEVTVTVREIPDSGGMLIADVSESHSNYSFKFNNSVKITLPETGGEGVIPYIAGGGILITVAVVLIILKKRKKEEPPNDQ